jgi:GT2 family glycosyltransferase
MEVSPLPSAARGAAPGRSPSHSVETIAVVPRISVVVINYRQWSRTDRLVQGLLESVGVRRGLVEVVVVDNNSPPHPAVRRLREQSVSLRRWRRNRGFARAANEGCRLGRGDWVLLLNPDVTLPDDFIDGVLRLADDLGEREPRTGVVGFRLANPDGSPQLSSGLWPTLAGTLAGLALPRHRRKYRAAPASERCEVPWVTGCCFLVRQACVRQLGGFDERYFLYYEDVDFCRRARDAGWTVWFEPDLVAVHHRPLHSRRVPARLRCYTRHALLTYAGVHWPEWQAKLLSAVVWAEARVRAGYARLRGERGDRRLFSELASLAIDFVRNDPVRARRCLDRMVRRTDRRGTAVPRKG